MRFCLGKLSQLFRRDRTVKDSQSRSGNWPSPEAASRSSPTRQSPEAPSHTSGDSLRLLGKKEAKQAVKEPDDVQVFTALAKTLRELSGIQGPWLQRLHAAVVVLNKNLQGHLVSVSALMEGGYSYVLVAADGVGVGDLQLGVPHVVAVTSRPSNSLQRVFQSEAPVCASTCGMASSQPFAMPPDWLQHSSRFGSTDFLAVPIHRGTAVVGALSVMYTAAELKHPSLLSLGTLGLIAAALGSLFGSEQLMLLLSMLEDLSGTKDIDTLVKVLARGMSELCAEATYLAPQCRVALIREDGLAAAVFEERAPRRQSQSLYQQPVIITDTGSFASSVAGSASTAALPSPGREMDGQAGIPDAARPLDPAEPAAQAGMVRPYGATGLPGAGFSPPSICNMSLDLATFLNASPGDCQQQQQQLALPLPFIPKGRMARCSTAQSGLTASCSNSALGSMHKLSSSSRAVAQPAAPVSFSAHTLYLAQTLLGEAVQKQSGVWISDCSVYLQEIKVVPLDITISRHTRTINSLAVCSACIPGTTKPLVGIYCTYPATVPPLLLRAVTREVEQLLQALLPMVTMLLHSDMKREWYYLHDDALDPGRLFKARELQLLEASYSNTPSETPRTSVAGCAANAMANCCDRARALASPNIPLQREQQQGHQHSRDQLFSVSGTLHKINLGTGNAACEATGPGLSTLSQQEASREVQRHHKMLDKTASTSFTIQAAAAAGLHGTLGPLLIGMQDKLRELQSSRLLRSETQDQLEELAGIELLEKVGSGGYGAVYRGTHQGLEVAIKVIFSKGPQPCVTPQQQQQQRRSPVSGRTGTQQQTPACPAATANAGCSSGHCVAAAGGPLVAPILPRAEEAAGNARRQQEQQQASNVHEALELAAMFTVSHPNVVQVLTFFTDVTICSIGPDEMPPAAAFNTEGDIAPRILLLPATPARSPAAAAVFAAACGAADVAVAALAARNNVDEAVPACRRAMVICMEYCDAGSLQDAIQRGAFRERSQGLYGSCGPPNMQAIYTTLLEMAMALRHLHQLDLVHCDLKPENILLRSSARDPRGFVCKLSDFGLVRQLVCVDGRMVVKDHDSGTHTHMAPEVLLGSEFMDASLDIYAFGIIMWQLVTGSRVYAGLRADEVVDRVMHHSLRPRFPPSVGQAYSALAAACWSSIPEQRPTAAELVTSLKVLRLASSPLHATRARRHSSTAYMVANTRAATRKLPSIKSRSKSDSEDGGRAAAAGAARQAPSNQVDAPEAGEGLASELLAVPENVIKAAAAAAAVAAAEAAAVYPTHIL